MSFDFVGYCPNPAKSLLDRNGDGAVTISDIWRFIGDVLHLPGDLVIEPTLKAGGDVPRFLEMSCKGMGGGWSTAMSLFAWFICWGVVYGAIREARGDFR